MAPVTRIVGNPSAESDAAVARYLERFLSREDPRFAWRVGEPDKDSRLLEAAAGQVVGAGAGGVEDDGPVAA